MKNSRLYNLFRKSSFHNLKKSDKLHNFDLSDDHPEVGDRVVLVNKKHTKSKSELGSVVDMGYSPHYVLVKWDNDMFNRNITHLCTHPEHRRFEVHGSAIPINKIKVLKKRGIQFHKTDNIRNSYLNKDSSLKSSQIKTIESNRTINRRNSEFGIPFIKSVSQKDVMRNFSVSNDYKFNDLKNIKKDSLAKTQSIPRFEEKKITTVLNSFMKNVVNNQTNEESDIQDNSSKNTQTQKNHKFTPAQIQKNSSQKTRNKSPRSAPLISSSYTKNKNKEFKQTTINNKKDLCKNGHLMVRRKRDTYNGVGVKCDECNENDIHSNINGFFHCEVCENVDLCEKCARKNLDQIHNTHKTIDKTDLDITKEQIEEYNIKHHEENVYEKVNKRFENKNSKPNFKKEKCSKTESYSPLLNKIKNNENEQSNEVFEDFWFTLLDKSWLETRSKTQPNISNDLRRCAHHNMIEMLSAEPEKAFDEYKEMIKNGIYPNALTFFIILSACGQSVPPMKKLAHQLVIHMQTLQVEPNYKVINALLNIFSNKEDRNWKLHYSKRFKNYIDDKRSKVREFDNIK